MDEQTKGYRQLLVWQKAMELVTLVYRLIKLLPAEERFALCDQMRRAAVSIPANIAEGQARSSKKEFRYFLSIARGSLAELDTLLSIALNLHYLKESDLKTVTSLVLETRRLLQGLMRMLRG